MTRLLVTALMLLALTTACSPGTGDAAIEGEIWVANAASSDVRIYDATSFERLATVAVDRTPQSLTIRPGGNEVWVVNVDGQSISVVDSASHEVTQTIRSDDMVDGPTELRFSEDGGIAYLVGSGGVMNLIDPRVYRIVDAKPVGIFTYGLTVMPDGTLRTANRQSGDVSVVTRRGEFIDRFPSGPSSYDVTADPDGTAIYVTARDWNAVSVLDSEDHELQGAIPVGSEPSMAALAPDGTRLFVANSGDSTLSMIDTTTFELHGPGGVSIGDVLDVGDEVGTCPECVEPVVADWDGDPVEGTVVRFAEEGVALETAGGERVVPDNAFLGVEGGLRPHGLTVTDDGRFLLAAFNASDDVFVYDARTGEQIAWLHGCEDEPSPEEPGCNPGAIDVLVVDR